jgi:EAL domain-containing protein (putative c-di-GMP-specific phosphodiesterase class I)
MMAVLERHGVPAQRLLLEITESAAMEEPERTEPLLREFRRLGFRVAIDDFGAQHASLGRLSELAVDVLKIDRRFLVDVPQRADASAILVAIIELAGALGMGAVAEGIETAEQYRFLADRGCPFGQGFALARPMPAAAATEHLTRARDLALRSGSGGPVAGPSSSAAR